MSQRIASYYAEITADTSKLNKGLGDAKTNLEKFKSGVDGVNNALKQVGIVAVGLGAAAKVTYDLARSGASLEQLSTKFDRLAVSVGSTGDLMLGELREASRGLYSDAQLMQQATDMMALGFATTQEEAVRLSKVASALNMDMNQLTLTLANQTTMRFDQLGVAVVGFDERLAKLKASGMDTNAAFKEAFLQQAEAQILRVGEAADTSIGSFMRLEAQVNNLGDALKIALSNAKWNFAGVEGGTQSLVVTLTQLVDVAQKYPDYQKRMNYERKQAMDLLWKEVAAGKRAAGFNEEDIQRQIEANRRLNASIAETRMEREKAREARQRESSEALAAPEPGKTAEQIRAENSAYLEGVQTWVSLSEAASAYAGEQRSIADQAAEINRQINEARGQGYSETGSRIMELKGQLADLNAALIANSAEFMKNAAAQVAAKMQAMAAGEGSAGGVLITEEEQKAIDAFMLSTGLATEKGLQLRDAQLAIAEAMLEGVVPAEKFEDIMKKIYAMPPNKKITVEFVASLVGSANGGTSGGTSGGNTGGSSTPPPDNGETQGMATGGKAKGWFWVGDTRSGLTGVSELVYAPQGAYVLSASKAAPYRHKKGMARYPMGTGTEGGSSPHAATVLDWLNQTGGTNYTSVQQAINAYQSSLQSASTAADVAAQTTAQAVAPAIQSMQDQSYQSAQTANQTAQLSAQIAQSNEAMSNELGAIRALLQQNNQEMARVFGNAVQMVVA